MVMPMRHPVPRQQFVQTLSGMACDPGEHVGKPGAWIDVVQLRRNDERVHRRGPLAAPVGACEQPCLAAERHTAQRAFSGVVQCALSRRTILPGGNPGRQTLAPAGSTRGGSGGDEWSEALREKGPEGGQRTVRAAT